MTAVCKGADAVISAFNPGWNNPDIYDETIKVYLTIIDGVKKAGVNRFLMVGGAGSLFIAPGLRLMDSGEVPENILPGVKALGEFYLNFLKKEKEIDWVFFSPAADMRSGVRTGRYRLGKDDMIVDIVGNSHISVEDYAAAMIDELITASAPLQTAVTSSSAETSAFTTFRFSFSIFIFSG